MNYTDYQGQESSEKIVLAIVHAARRLMAWTVHSGSVYKLTNLDIQIVSIEDSGTAYTEAASLGAIAASKYYYDRAAQTLYIQTTGSDNPNSRVIVLTQKFNFANVPIVLPHDLSSGDDVMWEPMIADTSSFGVQLDTINQTGEAIEGSGQIVFHNDQEFWPDNFDTLFWENQNCYIYSYNRNIGDPTQAKMLFQGKVEKKSYGNKISFSLRDLLTETRTNIPLSTLADLGQRSLPSLDQAKQRMIFGRVYGFRPVNIDEVLDGYPITGTISINSGSASMTGSGTSFLNEISPGDKFVLAGTEYAVATVSTDTTLTLTETFTGSSNITSETGYIIPEEPKRWMNRVWKIAGHALRQPVMTIQTGSTISRLIVDSNADVIAGDTIYIGSLGSGESVIVDDVYGTTIIALRTSLATIPTPGTSVHRPAVQNVRINGVLLQYYTDYTLDATNAQITLADTAEKNAEPLKQVAVNYTFSNGSRTVTGSGFSSLRPGDLVGRVGVTALYEVFSVESDTSLTLRQPADGTIAGTANGYKKSLILDPNSDVLSFDVLGRTSDGTSSGSLIITAPSVVKTLLQDAGLTSQIDITSFDEAEDLAPQEIGLVIPERYSDTTTPKYRDIINKVGKSVLGNLIQTTDFMLGFEILNPDKNPSATRLREDDVISLDIQTSAENMVKTVKVEYQIKEYDYLSNDSSLSTKQSTSDTSTYVLKTTREKTVTSYLAREADAGILSSRWLFLLDYSSGRFKIKTKLQGALLEVGSIIDLEHRKLFERFGNTGRRVLLFVEGVKKDGANVIIEAVDFSNAFTRVAGIMSSGAPDYGSETDEERLYGGWITDQYGVIDDNPDSFGTNLIW